MIPLGVGLRETLHSICLANRKVHVSTPPRYEIRSHSDAAFAAYGWKSELSDEEILEKLLALNIERAKVECPCEEVLLRPPLPDQPIRHVRCISLKRSVLFFL